MNFHEVSYPDIPDIVRLSEKVSSCLWSADSYLCFIERADTDFEIYRREGSILPLEGFYLSATVEREAELLMLAVRTDLWGQRIGQSLLERWMQRAEARHCLRCHLEVSSNNERAIRLYRRNGFLTVGMRRGYYGSEVDDALVMSLELVD